MWRKTNMPTPYIQKLSKERGISVAKLEKKWDEAKKIAEEEYGNVLDDKFYAIVTSIFKRMVGEKTESKFKKSLK